jgi:hypothetical protein
LAGYIGVRREFVEERQVKLTNVNEFHIPVFALARVLSR